MEIDSKLHFLLFNNHAYSNISKKKKSYLIILHEMLFLLLNDHAVTTYIRLPLSDEILFCCQVACLWNLGIYRVKAVPHCPLLMLGRTSEIPLCYQVTCVWNLSIIRVKVVLHCPLLLQGYINAPCWTVGCSSALPSISTLVCNAL